MFVLVFLHVESITATEVTKKHKKMDMNLLDRVIRP